MSARWCSVPVGMYHHVNAHSGDVITVSTSRFREQMERLVKENVTTLSSEDFLRYKKGLSPAPPRSLLITFDDAWLDVYAHAFPILRELGLRFVIFVVGQWSEQAGSGLALPSAFPRHKEATSKAARGETKEVVCGWDHLSEMLASGLCSIENHTAHHRVATRTPLSHMTDEIEEGRSILRRRLGVQADQLCWPEGRTTAAAEAEAVRLGVSACYLVRRGINPPWGSPHHIKRFTVEDQSGDWLDSQIRLFSRPAAGWLYSRLKPDRLWAKWQSRFQSRPAISRQ